MPKFEKSQILLLSLLIALLSLTPLLSPNQRTLYLYFIMNLLIIALGADAGLLSFFLKPSQENKKNETGHNNTNASSKEAITTSPINTTHDMEITKSNNNNMNNNTSKDFSITSKIVVEKCASEKIVAPVKVNRVKKCPSTPSIFFIGGGETPAQAAEDRVFEESEGEAEAEEEVGGISRRELFAKAENFIGDFYEQLRMQREESWKKIHGQYHQAF